MDSYGDLIESLAARSPAGRSRRVSEKAVRAAVAGLPLANPGQAMLEVEQLLEGMLDTVWPGAERLAALERLRTPVAALCEGVEHEIGAQSHPLAQTVSERTAGVQRLHAKLACGYALGLHELCAPAGKLPRFKSRLATTAAVRGLVHSDQALVWANRRYQTPPEGLWRRVHALYAFAGELGLAGRVVEDAVGEGGPCNVRDAYARILLFAISNPSRFSVREMEEARRACRCVASLCVVTRVGDEGIAVDTAADSGPGYIAAERLDADSGVMSFDVTAAANAIDERIALLPPDAEVLGLPQAGGGTFTTTVPFLRRLCMGWSNATRDPARLAATHELDIVVGMHALHYALAGNIDFAGFVRQVRGDAITIGPEGLPSAWMAVSDTAHPRVFRGEVLDQSEGGYRMRLTVVDGLRLRIGDVVGLAPVVEGVDTRDWMVGVVRWLHHEADNVLLGIELLCREARAAGVRGMSTDGGTPAPQRAVELRGRVDRDALSLLVTHPFTGHASAFEVMLPRLASDWRSEAAIDSWRPGGTEVLGPACFRVTLVRETECDSN